MKRSTKLRLWPTLIVLVGFAALAVAWGQPLVAGLGRMTLVAVTLALLGWLLAITMRRLLWRVGRRLAITYVLIGALPILLVVALFAVGGYLLAGFHLGHLFRVALGELAAEVATATESAAGTLEGAGAWPAQSGRVALAYYRDGVRTRGDERAPARWPVWLETETDLFLGTHPGTVMPRMITLEDRGPTVAAALSRGNLGVVGFLDAELERALAEQSGVWVHLIDPADGDSGGINIRVLDAEFVLKPIDRTGIEPELAAFYRERGTEPGFMVLGLESPGPVHEAVDGEPLTGELSATLRAPLSFVVRNLVPSSPEVDTIAWIAFIVPAFLLFDVYLLAAVMAVVLIVSLSRAVDRLSAATAAVQDGDFSVRIPVRRNDQVGELQRSFNTMTANLEEAVKHAATKELLDKELGIARELQEGLLPSDFSGGHDLELATYFEPSAVIGGDFFDVRRLAGDPPRAVVVIADVSGHGIPAALRMTMLKAALDILIEEGKSPEQILVSLDTLVRSNRAGGRAFVTATLAILDLRSGILELTNAGHPPTYLLRDQQIEEIMLEGTPLGALGRDYGRHVTQLQPGDVLIWLSDGLIEATDHHDDSFGFERTAVALAGDCSAVQDVRDRLIDAVRRHCGEREPDDDRTMVVLRYVGTDQERHAPPESVAAERSTEATLAASAPN